MMKQMLMVVAMLAVMVIGLAAPAMAEEVQNPPNDPPPVEEEPYKDPGIRQCDLTPTPCQDTDEGKDSTPHEPQVVCIKAPCPGSSDSSAEEEDRIKDPGIRQCDITPVECEDTEEQKEDEPYKDLGIRQCDLTPPYCEDAEEQEEAEPKKGEANASVTPQDEQTADSGTTYDVCFYDDYYYDQETEMCWPNGGPFAVLTGNKPWPDSAGGYVGLLGDFVEDPLTGLGLGLQQGLGYVGDTLVEFGEDGGPIGWAIQGAGYAIGFFGDAGGELTVHVSEAVGAVADGVGEVVDAIGDAAGAAYDEIASWF